MWSYTSTQKSRTHIKSLTFLNRRYRISKTYFIKLLPKANSVEKHLIDLPKTAEWLQNNQESFEDYRKYRLQIACQTLKELNLPLLPWRLLRLASIRKAYITENIERYIAALVDKNETK